MEARILNIIFGYMRMNDVHKMWDVKNYGVHALVLQRSFRKLIISKANILNLLRNAKYYHETLDQKFIKSLSCHKIVFKFMRDTMNIDDDGEYGVVDLRDYSEWIDEESLMLFIKFCEETDFNIRW